MTLQEMNKAIAELSELRIKAAKLSAEKKEIDASINVLEGALIDTLVENNLDQYRGPDGLISISKRTSVKTPKSDEDKRAFFAYLQSKGLFDTMVNVNSMTLNAFYKEELANAEAAGNFEFKIPGLNEVTITPTLSFRK